ncbi:ROK family protein [uncultured Olegusella sp.]|uniref:ROK family protein n=1 Tax=uncultured Olegusella sp. TaxID=1979846 RepID=UPI002622917D|nr:ROK family protein [uncultured Olegusella sp.]
MVNEKMRFGALEAGGTKMVLAVGNAVGEVYEQEEIPTEAPDVTVPHIIKWFADKSISTLGVGAFGPTGVNPASPSFGKILETPKLAWRNYDFLGALKGGLGIPVGYDTDVNVACLGEAMFGAGRGLDCLIYLTVGTGIGAGVMIDGRLLHGMLHPETGHVLIERKAGDKAKSSCAYHDNCVEGLASGPAIALRWGKPASELADNADVWELEAAYLSRALSTYVLCYSPQRIILGGGVMKQQHLFPLIRSKLLTDLGGYIKTPEIANIESYVVPAGCEGKQGILGCLTLAARTTVAP